MGAPQRAIARTLTRSETDALGEQIAQHAAHLDAATHRLLTDIRTFDRECGWHRQGATSCAHWLSWRVGWSVGTAREHVRVANRLADLPLIDDALRRGELSYCKVRALTRVATPTNEALLLTDALHSTGFQLEEICRKYASLQRTGRRNAAQDLAARRVTRRELDDGMIEIKAVLRPDEAVAVWEALSHIARERSARGDAANTNVDALPATDAATSATVTSATETDTDARPRFSRADALVEMSEHVLRGTAPERTPVEVVVSVSAETLARTNPDAPPFAYASDGALLSIDTVRRLACDAGIVVALEDANGSTIDMGRRSRSANAALKRALKKRDTTCRFPGCNNRQFLDVHHCTHWANGGATNTLNNLLLCKFHHPFMHEYGFTVRLDENQQPIFTDPRGRIIVDTPERPVTAGMQDVRDLNRSLGIGASTNRPRWNGLPVNYGWVVDDLLRAGRRSADVSAETSTRRRETSDASCRASTSCSATWRA